MSDSGYQYNIFFSEIMGTQLWSKLQGPRIFFIRTFNIQIVLIKHVDLMCWLLHMVDDYTINKFFIQLLMLQTTQSPLLIDTCVLLLQI